MSILNQDFGDLELLVIDDASSDDSMQKLREIDDDRLRILRNDRQLGLAASLNRGLELAQGELVARMDADDIAMQDRLSRQISLLDDNPEVMIVGGDIQPIDEYGRPAGDPWAFPQLPWQIRWRMLFGSSLAHPTIVARRQFFDRVGLYAEDHPAGAEDYELWLRALHLVDMGNVPEVVLQYRRHPSSSTMSQTAHHSYVIAAGTRAIEHVIGREVSEPQIRALWEPLTGGAHQPEALVGAVHILNDLFEWSESKAMSASERTYIRYRGAWTLRAILRSLARNQRREALSLAVASPLITWEHLFHATAVKLRLLRPPERL